MLLLIPGAGAASSVEFFLNDPADYDYGIQLDIPAMFGQGEFTLEIWLRPNDSFPVGSVDGGINQRRNWSEVDNAPYSTDTWWFEGNFLLDGHNNNVFEDGTFSLQFYGGGRLRWLFGDGATAGPGGHWSVGAYPATTTSSLLDGQWHQVTLVRRWSGTSSADLELWIDGVLIDSETSSVRTNMRQWWDSWSEFPPGQEGWFWGAEKQAAIGLLNQYEDYKGLIDELRFWSRAKSPAEIMTNFADEVPNSAQGLAAKFTFGEGQGVDVCDALDVNLCVFLVNTRQGTWAAEGAPLNSPGDTAAPSVPQGLQGTAVSPSQIDLAWLASSDNVAVSGYDIRRDGQFLATTSQTTYGDTGLSPATAYVYTVAARDAAGNVSSQSAPASVTTPATLDTSAPTAPGNLRGTAVSHTEIQLNWDSSTDDTGVTGYDVRRDGQLIATTVSTGFLDTGLSASTGYEYSVSARDAAGNVSAPSTNVTVTTLAAPVTQSPSGGGGVIDFWGLIALIAGLSARRTRRLDSAAV